MLSYVLRLCTKKCPDCEMSGNSGGKSASQCQRLGLSHRSSNWIMTQNTNKRSMSDFYCQFFCKLFSVTIVLFFFNKIVLYYNVIYIYNIGGEVSYV